MEMFANALSHGQQADDCLLSTGTSIRETRQTNTKEKIVFPLVLLTLGLIKEALCL